MFGCSNNLASDLFPINTVVQLLINESNYCDIVTSDKVQAMANFGAGLWVICRSDDPLDSLVQNDVGDLVAGQERADQCSPIDSNDENLLLAKMLAFLCAPSRGMNAYGQYKIAATFRRQKLLSRARKERGTTTAG